MHMWGEDTPVPMHICHFGYGLGSFIAPQVALPFLSSTPDDVTTISSLMTTELNTYTHTSVGDLSRIEIPFIIGASITAAVSLWMLVFFLKGLPQGMVARTQTPLSLEMCSPQVCGRGHSNKAIILLLLLLFYYTQIVGAEICFATFIFSYATQKDNPMSKPDAALLNTLYFGSYTTGRAVGIIVSKYVSPDMMIMTYSFISLISAIILTLFAYNNDVILWIFVILSGFTLSIHFPAGMAWANHYLNMNAMAVFVLIFGAGTGGAAYQYSSGYWFQVAGPRSMMYIVLFSTAMTMLAFILMFILAKLLEKKSKMFDIEPMHE